MKVLPKNILVVKNRALGDSIMGLSSISYLKQHLPKAKITYAIPGWIHPLYLNCSSDADKYLPLNLSTPFDYLKLAGLLVAQKFDLIIELHQTGRTSRFFKIYSILTKTKYIYHNHNLKTGRFIFDQGIKKPSIQRDLDCCYSTLVKYINLDLQIPNYLHYPPTLNTASTNKEKLIVLGVVATRKTKLWPIENYIELIKLILDNYGDYKFIIPLSTNAIDQNIKKILTKINLPSSVKIIENPLATLPEIMAKGTIYIGNDTGLKHLAIALNLITFTFFGPEEPLEWHPYDSSTHKYFFINDLECRIKTSHYCGLDTCDNHSCLNQISVESTFQEIRQHLF